MMKLNNKGQSLALFIALIPIILLMFVFVYDIGNSIYEKNRLSNACELAMNYGLSNIEAVSESDLVNLIMKNTDNVNNISVIIENNEINIKASKDINNIFNNISGLNIDNIYCEYHGKITDDKKEIERVK